MKFFFSKLITTCYLFCWAAWVLSLNVAAQNNQDEDQVADNHIGVETVGVEALRIGDYTSQCILGVIEIQRKDENKFLERLRVHTNLGIAQNQNIIEEDGYVYTSAVISYNVAGNPFWLADVYLGVGPQVVFKPGKGISYDVAPLYFSVRACTREAWWEAVPRLGVTMSLNVVLGKGLPLQGGGVGVVWHFNQN